jgi:translocation and assembly module TamB
MRRARFLLIALAILVGLPLAVLVVGLVAVQTGPGKRILAERIGTLAGSPDLTIAVGGIEGFVPFDMTVRDVVLGDASGPAIRVDRARLAWSPLALFTGTFHVDAIDADTVTIDRLPVSHSDEPASSGPLLLDLPVTVAVDRLSVGEIALGTAVVGTEARYAAWGRVRLGDAATAGLTADLALHRIDAPGGQVSATLTFVPGAERLDLAARIAEPAGGLVARLAGIPGLPPLAVTLDGRGTLSDWQGSVSGGAGQDARWDGTLRIAASGADRLRATLDASASVAPLLPADIAAAMAGTTRIGLTVDAARDGSGPIAIGRFSLRSAAADLDISGTADPDASSFDLLYAAGAPAATPLAAFLPPGTAWRDLAVSGRAHGFLSAPSVTVDLSASDLAYGPYAAETLTASLEAVPDGLLRDPRTAVALTGSGEADGVTLGDPGLDSAVSRRATFAIDGRGSRAGPFAVRTLLLNTATADLSFTGEGDFVTLALNGRLVAKTEDLAPFGALLGRPAAGRLDLTLDAAGPIDRPDVTLNLRGSGLRFDAYAADSIAVDLAAMPDGPFLDRATTVALSTTGSAAGLSLPDPALAAALSSTVAWRIDGTGSQAGPFAVQALSLSTDDASVTFEGRGDFSVPAATGRLSAHIGDLSAFADLLGTRLAGAADLALVATGEPDRPQIAVRLAARDIAYDRFAAATVTGDLTARPDGPLLARDTTIVLKGAGDADGMTLADPSLDRALSSRLDWRIDGSGSQAGRFAVETLSIRTANADLGFAGRGDLDTLSLNGTLNARTADLAPFGALIGRPMAGSIDLSIAAVGPYDRPAIDLSLKGSGLRFDADGAESIDVALSLRPQGALADPATTVAIVGDGSATGVVLADPALVSAVSPRVSFRIDAEGSRNGPFVARALSAETENARLSYAGAGDFLGAIANGRLRLVADDLAAFAGLAQTPMAGSVDIGIDALGPVEAPRTIALNVTGRGLGYGPYAAEVLDTALTVMPDGSLAADATAFVLRGSGSAAGLVLGDAALESAASKRATWTVDATAARTGRFDVRALSIETGTASLAFTGAGDFMALAVTGKLSARAADLAAFSALAGAPLAGSLAVELAATGDPASPDLALAIDGQRIARGGLSAATVTARATARPDGPLRDPATMIAVDSEGRIDDIATGDPEIDRLSRAVTWRLSGSGARAGPFDIPELLVDATTASVRFHGRGDFVTLAFDGALDATAQDLSAFERLAGRPLAGALNLAVLATGPIERPDVTLSLTGEKLLFDDYAAERATVTARLQPDGPILDPATRLAVVSEGDIAGLAVEDPTLAPFLSNHLSWDVDGSAAGAGPFDIERFSAHTGTIGARFEGRGDFAQPSLAGDLRLAAPDLSVFSGLAGQPLHGALAIAIEATHDAAAGTRAALSGTVGDPSMRRTAIATLFGKSAAIGGTATYAPDGTATLSRLAIDGTAFDLSGDGRLTAGAVDGTFRVTVDDIAAVAPGMGGRLTMDATARGAIDAIAIEARAVAENLVTGGPPIERLAVELSATGLPAAPAGSLSFEGTASGQPARGRAAFSLGADGSATLSDLAVDGFGVQAQGQATMAADGALGGEIRVSRADMAIVGRLIGQDLGGTVQGTLSLDERTRRAVLAVTAERIRYAGDAAVATARLDAVAIDPLGADLRIEQARLSTRGLDAGGTVVSTAQLDMSGTLQQIALDLRADGSLGTVRLVATIAGTGSGGRIDLSTLSLSSRGRSIALARPGVIDVGTDGITLRSFDLSAAGGALSATGTVGANLNVALRLSGLPLSVSEIAAPGIGLEGTLAGEAAITGTPAAPAGRFSFQARNVSAPDLRQAGIDPIDATVTGELRGQSVAVDARIDAGADIQLAVAGTAPLSASGSLDARITGRAELGLINDFLSDGADRVAGPISIDLAVTGPMARPNGSGTIRLTGGAYENGQYGVRLSQLNATITGNGQALDLSELSAQTPGGGTVSGSGRMVLDFDAGLPADISLRTSNATLVDYDLMTATVDSDLRFSGPVLGDSALTGTVRIRQADIRVPDRLPASVTPIAVRHVNVPPEIAAQFQTVPVPSAAPRRGGGNDAPEDASDPTRTRLDITVTAQNRLYVRGQGIDAELMGDIHIGGTAEDPDMSGDFEMRRGTFSQLGQTFTFDRGRVVFVGGSLDPELDFAASTSAGDVTATINVGGLASRPEITLSSVPELPQDEILSRILFGAATGELTPGQAIQLAQAAAQLAGVGGGGGLLSGIQSSLGLDQLGIVSNSSGGTGIGIGGYIDENIRVGVEQGITAGDTKATVSIDITPNIKAELGYDQESGGGGGVAIEWDY